MSYIIKNSTQGAIVARLTDAGRKKLSEGKLNIGPEYITSRTQRTESFRVSSKK